MSKDETYVDNVYKKSYLALDRRTIILVISNGNSLKLRTNQILKYLF